MKTKTLELFNTFKATPSDINEHLDTLYELAKECETVIEFGTRAGVSTSALFLGCDNVITYDIEHRSMNHFIEESARLGLGFEFRNEDDLEIKPVQCDMLFIDTYHVYNQLMAELILHCKGVKKYIVLHDTETFGSVDFAVPEGRISEHLLKEKKQGLMTAVEDFCKISSWKIKHHYPNNNGLTVLCR